MRLLMKKLFQQPGLTDSLPVKAQSSRTLKIVSIAVIYSNSSVNRLKRQSERRNRLLMNIFRLLQIHKNCDLSMKYFPHNNLC